MRLTITCALAATALALTIGCGGRTLPGSHVDDGGIPDAPPWQRDLPKKKDTRPAQPDTGGPLPPNCPGCRDYVFSQILMPSTSHEAQAYALVHQGKKYNALGNIIALLASQAPSMSVKDSVSHSINKGKAILLMRLQADNLVNDPTVRAQLWLGKDAKCCSVTYSPSQCAKQAAATCFNGNGGFYIDPASPKDMIFTGSIQGGKLTLGPGLMTLKMSMSKSIAHVPVKYAWLRGGVSQTSITGGVLNGAIPKGDLEQVVIPQIAKMLDETLKTADSKTRKMIEQLFDVNHDGKISTSEVANNALIKTFLGGDVDVEPDGIRELSLGVGFSAVRARFKH